MKDDWNQTAVVDLLRRQREMAELYQRTHRDADSDVVDERRAEQWLCLRLETDQTVASRDTFMARLSLLREKVAKKSPSFPGVQDKRSFPGLIIKVIKRLEIAVDRI